MRKCAQLSNGLAYRKGKLSANPIIKVLITFTHKIPIVQFDAVAPLKATLIFEKLKSLYFKLVK